MTERGSSPGDTRVARLVAMLESLETFVAKDGTAFATCDGVAVPLNSSAFKSRLVYSYFLRYGGSPGRASDEVIEVLCARASAEGKIRDVFTRVGGSDGTLYLDLMEGRYCEVRRDGWDVVERSPVHFQRPAGMLPLPTPQRTTTPLPQLLAPFLNSRTPDDTALIVGIVLAALRPRGPYPVGVLSGPQGSAKSSVAWALKMLICPSATPLVSLPSDDLSVLVSSKHSHFLAWDNVSHLSENLSDALCRLSTGAGISRRKLFSDSDLSTIGVCKPVLLNGIEDFCVRGDLLSRCITVELAPIKAADRMTDEAFKNRYLAQLPCLLGATLNALSMALRTYDANGSIEHVDGCRMADLLLWVEAGSEALGWEPGTFTRAYKHNLSRGSDLALEACVWLPSLLSALRTGGFKGTASQFLQKLKADGDDWEAQRTPAWPKTPRQMSNALKRLQPNLASVGIQVARERGSDHDHSRILRIWREGSSQQPKPGEKDVLPF